MKRPQSATRIALLSVLSIMCSAVVFYPAILVFGGMVMAESGRHFDVPIWLAGGLAASPIGAAASLPWVVARRSASPCVALTALFFVLGLLFGLIFSRA
jgi:hypothetical protein